MSGTGIHSGRPCTVRLYREEGPLIFLRAGRRVRARLENVASAERCVVLSDGGATVATVEHLLAALRLHGFWSGVAVEATADELPILDGSAAPWLEAVARLGAPTATPEPIVVCAEVEASAGKARASVAPGASELDVGIDFDHPAIGSQRWRGGPPHWKDLADARTFGFLAELDALRAAGLATGADPENAIVFDDRGPLVPLRHVDEPVRHKALDLLGDLALLGRPLRGRVRVRRGSHLLHMKLMHQLLLHHPHPEPAA